MARYEVLRPIEHDQKLYLPKGTKVETEKVASAGHGREIDHDTSGMIELEEKQAKALTEGQVALIPEEGKKKK